MNALVSQWIVSIGHRVTWILKPLLLPLVVLCCLYQQAYADDSLEKRIKAAFIYNFTQFIEWPNRDNSKFLNICVLGKDVLSNELNTIDGKIAQGKSIIVKHIDDEIAVRQCQVLFVRITDANYRTTLLEQLGEQPVLTISDSTGFAKAGGIIQFYMDGKHVHFAINKGAADRAGLAVSSKLLHLAKIIGVDRIPGI